MELTPLGMTRAESKASHSLNAFFPIDVTFSGILISVKDLHLEKASSPILVIVSGRVTEVNQLQEQRAHEATPHRNIYCPVVVADSGPILSAQSLHRRVRVRHWALPKDPRWDLPWDHHLVPSWVHWWAQ